MQLFKTVANLQSHVQGLKQKKQALGFVPTMGALHEGHLSLIDQAKNHCDQVVCSIFVNPTQFNDKSDLDKYPRTTEKDLELLRNKGCDIVLLPSVEEVYPPGLDTTLNLDFGKISEPMEGRHRPGHFDGMAQVVKRLLDMVQPNKLFMGQKDFQQFMIVRSMIEQLELPIELIMCPIIREDDGLAMSSRNVRLDANSRLLAVNISKTLKMAIEDAKKYLPATVKKRAIERLDIPEFTLDYFEVSDAISLEAIEHFDDTKTAVACVALTVGGIRLIDNMILKGNLY